MTKSGDSIDDFLAKNTIPSANENGKQRKKGGDRESDREELQSGIRKFSKAKVQSASEASANLNQAKRAHKDSMEPNVPEAIDNKAGKKLGGSRLTRKERARGHEGMEHQEDDMDKQGYDVFSGAPPVEHHNEQYYTEDTQTYAGSPPNQQQVYQTPNHQRFTQHPPIPGQHQHTPTQVAMHPRARQAVAPQYQHLVQQPQPQYIPPQQQQPQMVQQPPQQQQPQHVAQPQVVEVEKEVIKEIEVEVPSETDTYLSGSKRITIKTNDGMFMLPAIDVRATDDCVTLLLPIKEDNTTFIPNRGTEMTVIWREGGADRNERVFFPGTCVEVQELRVIIVALIVISDNSK
jgi:hypothetical protein